jgi:hypothetical protein
MKLFAMKRVLLLFAAIVLCGIMPVRAQTGEKVIAMGTQMRGIMTQSVSSQNARVGDVFLLDVVQPYPQNDSEEFAGAKVRAHVVRVSRASQGREPKLEFVLDRIALTDGAWGSIAAAPISVQTRRSSNLGHVALTTAGGLVAGNIIGKWLGTNSGGAIGAVAGLLYGINQKRDVTVPAGSEVTFQLERPVTLRT